MARPAERTVRDVADAASGLALLVATSLAGDAVARATHAPVPGTVIGLLLMLALLAALGRVPRGLALAARWLIRHLNLFYIPAAVGITAYAPLLYRDRWPIAAALLVGTWVAIAAGALTFQAIARRVERRLP